MIGWSKHHKPHCGDCFVWRVNAHGDLISGWCPTCKTTAVHGPSTDTPEVLVEIRAAELALGVHDDGGPRLKRFTDGAEYAGWIEHAFDSAKVPEQPGEWAGWLARQIATHDEEQS